MERTTWQTHSCLCRHLEASSLCLYLVSPHSQGPRGGHCLLSRRTHLCYHWLLVYVCVCASVCMWTCDSLMLYFFFFLVCCFFVFFFLRRVSSFVLSSWADKVKELISIHAPVPTQTGSNWEDTAAAGWSGSLSVTHFIRRRFSVPPWWQSRGVRFNSVLCRSTHAMHRLVSGRVHSSYLYKYLYTHFTRMCFNTYQIISTGY